MLVRQQQSDEGNTISVGGPFQCPAGLDSVRLTAQAEETIGWGEATTEPAGVGLEDYVGGVCSTPVMVALPRTREVACTSWVPECCSAWEAHEAT